MEKTIYFLFTNTGTYLSRMINYYTKQSLNHVSIGFDKELTEVYSFGRKRPNNPFIGGFVCENVSNSILRESTCAIYTYRLTEAEYEEIICNIKEIEANKKDYKYNFIGLFGVALQIEIKRKNKLFCSQFVATVLNDATSFQLSKPNCFITPTDIRTHLGMNLIYQGKLEGYYKNRKARKLIIGDQTSTMQSFIFLLSKKVKRLVVR